MPKGLTKTPPSLSLGTRSRPAGPRKPPHTKATRSSKSSSTDSSKIDSSAVISELKKVREARNFNAEPSLTLDDTGVCRINTGKMSERSQREIYNYAFLVNDYISQQRGGQVKIKSTKKKHVDQALFCGAVRKINEILFDELNQGLESNNKMFSVVAHVPDECIQVNSFGASHNQSASTSTAGIGQAPGWMPMTRQANALVARIGNQTQSSTGQETGPYVSQFQVDGLIPGGLLPIKQVSDALGSDPYVDSDDDSSNDSSNDSSDDSGN